MNYLKIYARNTISITSIRPFHLFYINFNWDRPLWRLLAHINDTNLYVNFENSGRAHSWALRPLHLGSLAKFGEVEWPGQPPLGLAKLVTRLARPRKDQVGQGQGQGQELDKIVYK